MAFESRRRIRQVARNSANDLEGNIPTLSVLTRFVDLGHGSLAQQCQYLEPAQSFPDEIVHGRPFLNHRQYLARKLRNLLVPFVWHLEAGAFFREYRVDGVVSRPANVRAGSRQGQGLRKNFARELRL